MSGNCATTDCTTTTTIQFHLCVCVCAMAGVLVAAFDASQNFDDQADDEMPAPSKDRMRFVRTCCLVAIDIWILFVCLFDSGSCGEIWSNLRFE